MIDRFIAPQEAWYDNLRQNIRQVRQEKKSPMRLRSLKSKLLLAVSALVMSAAGSIIALLVTHRYSAALRKALVGQVENAAQTIALDAADKILVNDLVALQRMLDQQIQSNAACGLYL